MMKKSKSIIVCNCIWGNIIEDRNKSKCVGIDYIVIVLEDLSTRINHLSTYNLVIRKRLTQKVFNGFLFSPWVCVDEFTFEAVEKRVKWMNLIPTTTYKLSINDSTYMRLLGDL